MPTPEQKPAAVTELKSTAAQAMQHVAAAQACAKTAVEDLRFCLIQLQRLAGEVRDLGQLNLVPVGIAERAEVLAKMAPAEVDHIDAIRGRQ